MSNSVVCDISISTDGSAAGLGQTAEKPFGDGPVDRLHAWMFDTPDENKAETDRILAAGAFVMGRNMFGPVRGEWDLGWTGWWGETLSSRTSTTAHSAERGTRGRRADGVGIACATVLTTAPQRSRCETGAVPQL